MAAEAADAGVCGTVDEVAPQADNSNASVAAMPTRRSPKFTNSFIAESPYIGSLVE